MRLGLLGLFFLFMNQVLFAGHEQLNHNLLINKWRLASIEYSDSIAVIPEEKKLTLSFLKADSVFIEEFTADSLFLEGKWSVSAGNLLLLEYKLLPSSVLIDSSRYMVDNNTPEIVFYSKGKKVAGLLEGKLLGVPVTDTLTIISVTSNTLVLSNGHHILSYVITHDETAVYEETGFGFQSMLRGIPGLFVLLVIGYLFSSNRKQISWRVVGIGLAVQLVIAVLVLKVPVVQGMIEFVGQIFIKVLDFTKVGSEFLFGDLLDTSSFGVIFAFQILPTILFFSALTSILFYYGIIQKVVYLLAWILTKALKISGAESLSAAGNIFLGQTESPFLIKEYLKKMNDSEIMVVMVGGMATIAGGVLAIYIGLLGGDDPQERLLFAKHLITASVMAAPGAVVAAKLLVPQTKPIQSKIEITRESIGNNILDAISNGTVQGIRLAVNVGAMLIVFLALIALVNFVLLKVGDWTNLNDLIIQVTNGQYHELSLQFVLGYAFTPIIWAIGVPSKDITLVAQLFGEKIILNEMIAYVSMRDFLETTGFSYQKSVIMVTYLICGFANFASVGIQIGGIGALAPEKKDVLSRLGMKALLGGALASLLSATIVGMILG